MAHPVDDLEQIRKVDRPQLVVDIGELTVCPVQRFCGGVATWKFLHHPNVLPLLGVTMTENQFAVVLEWMEDGNINEFLKVHPYANRLDLVRSSFEIFIFALHR